MRVLVFGSTGQVARALRDCAWPEGTFPTFLERRAADFTAPDRLGAIVRAHSPDAVVIAAAFSQVDAAETDEKTARLVNAEAPGVIAQAAAGLSVPVIHLSTNYVFDGAKAGFYEEDDPPHPLNVYGRTKLAGEAAVRDANPKHLILRTSWVFSAFGSNILSAILALARDRSEVRFVSDEAGCPTPAPDLAAAIVAMLPALSAGRVPFGTFHLAGSDATTRHDFAETVFAALAQRGLRRPRNLPISSAEFAAPARRPLNGRLSSERFAEAFGIRLSGYRSALPKILDAALTESDA